jgi:micrococcal nuclease
MRTSSWLLLTGALAVLAALAGSAPLLGCESGPADLRVDSVRIPTGCCRVCTAGQACGDGCIPRHLTCHRDPGCACDAPDAPARRDRSPAPTGPATVRDTAPDVAELVPCAVERIIDGDTFVCEGLGRIRLLLVDAPERSQGEHGVSATRALAELLPIGAVVGLELDVRERDRYGRILAYVHAPDAGMVNVELARRGYVVVAVYPPNVRHVERIREAVAEARDAGRGLWSSSAFACEPAEHRAGRCP